MTHKTNHVNACSSFIAQIFYLLFMFDLFEFLDAIYFAKAMRYRKKISSILGGPTMIQNKTKLVVRNRLELLQSNYFMILGHRHIVSYTPIHYTLYSNLQEYVADKGVGAPHGGAPKPWNSWSLSCICHYLNCSLTVWFISPTN